MSRHHGRESPDGPLVASSAAALTDRVGLDVFVALATAAGNNGQDDETPWDALKYLISEANYGGRVTDEIDRRVLSGYLNQFFCEDALRVENFPLSSLDEYYVPKEGPLDSYREYIATLPVSDQPEAFGQHPNADISYMITDYLTSHLPKDQNI